MTTPRAAPGAAEPTARPPARPLPPELSWAARQYPGLITVGPAPQGGWRLTFIAAPLLTGSVDSADPVMLAWLADAFGAHQRSAARMCECGHSWTSHDIESKRKPCGRYGCGCGAFRERGDTHEHNSPAPV